MANVERRVHQIGRPGAAPEIHGVLEGKVKVSFLRESYARLYRLESKFEKNGASFAHPKVGDLDGKEELVRAISNWMIAHGDTSELEQCDNCNGTMDVSLVAAKKIPEVCVYCGDGPVEFGESPSSPASEVPEVDEELEREETPPPGAASAPEKEPEKKMKSEAKEQDGGKVVRVKKTKAGKLARAEEPTAEVVGDDVRCLLDSIEKITGEFSSTLSGAAQAFWDAGKFFAEAQKSKVWAKHPSNFGTWKEFVRGCFGVFFNEKRADEATMFYRAHRDGPPKDAGIRLPQLPRAANPKPRAPAEVERGAPEHDPSNISVAGVFKRKQRISLLTERGKPAKRLGDRPFAMLVADNGVTFKMTLGAKPTGELFLQVTISRE